LAKVFITGISGFIGSELARQMALEDHLVKGSSLTARIKTHIKCDIRKSSEILAAIASADPDIIIHTAALSSVTRGQTMDYYETNVLGTENVISAVDALGGRRRLIFVSTAAVYGNQKVEVLTEDLRPLPVSHYGMSKLVCERMIANASENHDITIVRPFNILGPGQDVNFIVPKLVQHFFDRKLTIRLGHLDPVRDYIDVQSCCNMIAQLSLNPQAIGETVNLCSGRGTSVRALLSELSELTQHSIKVIAAPEFTRKFEVWRLLGGVEKLHTLLPHIVKLRPFREVLLEMLSAKTSKSERVL
jgi:GDP-6-deoxy-D-talose 4-dehydrogenase